MDTESIDPEEACGMGMWEGRGGTVGAYWFCERPHGHTREAAGRELTDVASSRESGASNSWNDEWLERDEETAEGLSSHR